MTEPSEEQPDPATIPRFPQHPAPAPGRHTLPEPSPHEVFAEDGDKRHGEKPLLMNGEMVRATLAGRKKQTRRVATFFCEDISDPLRRGDIDFAKQFRPRLENGIWKAAERGYECKCPYGIVGDRLWVREMLRCTPDGQWQYAADGGGVTILPARVQESIAWSVQKKQNYCPSIHMPRWASRLTLRITDIRVERVQDISDADILTEGLEPDMLDLSSALKLKTKPEYWISEGPNEGMSYCHECAKKKQSEIVKQYPHASISGGYGIEGDSTPFCDTCGVRLENSLTDYGCEEEVNHFTQYGFDRHSPDDAHSMSQVISNQFWCYTEFASDSEFTRTHRRERLEAYHRLIWSIFWNQINGTREGSRFDWDHNPWVWVVTFERE